MKTKSSSADFLPLAPKSVRDINVIADKALAEASAELKQLLSVSKKEKRTVLNTFEPLNRIAIVLGGARARMGLFAAVHPDAKVRDAADKAAARIAKFGSDLYLNRDVYDAVVAVPLSGLDAEAKRFRDKEILDFKLSGVDKSSSVRRAIKKLAARSVKLGQTFDKNYRDDIRYIDLRSEDLDGLPLDYRKAHASDRRGVVRLSTQYPDVLPFLQYAKSESAREKFSFIYNNRAWPKNEPVFRELLAVRQKIARLIGFSDFADYVTVDKMVRSGSNVRKFLDRVAAIIKKRADADYAMFLARKKKADPSATTLGPWDVAYYTDLLTKERIGLDSQELRNYFVFSRVRDGVLASMGKLFGISYRKVKAPVWHKDVDAFDMYRAGKRVGRFYFDLHPREGKYGHAACFEIRPGIRGKQLPQVSLVCNFSRDLMTQDEIETFFHEFGHLIHYILAGDQRWARFSGFATEWDFVEAPSQMLESWGVDYETLRTFARHQKSGKPIPLALVKKVHTAESFGRGAWQRRQLFLSSLSLAYHEVKDPAKLDFVALMSREQKRYGALPYAKGTHMYTSFGHLNGYSAVYYTYSWSRAIAEEILGPFKRHGMYDKKTAKRYADFILAPGGSKDGRQLLRDFLGREWNLKAFEKWLKA